MEDGEKRRDGEVEELGGGSGEWWRKEREG